MTEEEKLTESLFEAPKIDQQERMVEAILFASSDPVTVKEIIGRLPHGCEPEQALKNLKEKYKSCLLYTSPSPRDLSTSRMPSSA